MVATLRKLEGGDARDRHGQHGAAVPAGADGRVPRRAPRGVAAACAWATASSWPRWMRANELDLAVMGRPPREIATRAEPFATNPLVLVTAADHPFVHMEQVQRAARVDGDAAAARGRARARAPRWRTTCASTTCTRRTTMEMPSNETIKQAVMAGLGVSLMSLHTLGLELQAGRHRHARGRGPADPAPLVPGEEPRQDAVAGGRGVSLLPARAGADAVAAPEPARAHGA